MSENEVAAGGAGENKRGDEAPAKEKSFTWLWVIGIIAVVVILVAIVAWGVAGKRASAQYPTFVDSVTVEQRGGDYYAIVEGNHPDACSETGDIVQEAAGNTIYLTIHSTKPEDMVCAQALAPFEEEIRLDTRGLDPGEIIVVINTNQAQTTFTLE